MADRFRLLTVVDHFTHECLHIVTDQSLRGEHVTEATTRLVAQRGKSAAIKVDNGSEFAGKVMDRRAYDNGVELDFSRRGTATHNAFVESFKGWLRHECLNRVREPRYARRWAEKCDGSSSNAIYGLVLLVGRICSAAPKVPWSSVSFSRESRAMPGWIKDVLTSGLVGACVALGVALVLVLIVVFSLDMELAEIQVSQALTFSVPAGVITAIYVYSAKRNRRFVDR